MSDIRYDPDDPADLWENITPVDPADFTSRLAPEKCDYCIAATATHVIRDSRDYEVAVCCEGCIPRYMRTAERIPGERRNQS